MTVPLEFKGFISFGTHLYQSLLSRKKITQFFSPYFFQYPKRFDEGLQDYKDTNIVCCDSYFCRCLMRSDDE